MAKGGAVGYRAPEKMSALSLLTWSFNLNPALRDQLTDEISSVVSKYELKRQGKGGHYDSALIESGVRLKKAFLKRRESSSGIRGVESTVPSSPTKKIENRRGNFTH